MDQRVGFNYIPQYSGLKGCTWSAGSLDDEESLWQTCASLQYSVLIKSQFIHQCPTRTTSYPTKGDRGKWRLVDLNVRRTHNPLLALVKFYLCLQHWVKWVSGIEKRASVVAPMLVVKPLMCCSMGEKSWILWMRSGCTFELWILAILHSHCVVLKVELRLMKCLLWLCDVLVVPCFVTWCEWHVTAHMCLAGKL